MASFDQKMEPSEAELRGMFDAVRDVCCEHVGSMREQPSSFPASSNDAVYEAMACAPLGDAPEPFAGVLAGVQDALQAGYNAATGGYLAFVAGGGLPQAAAAAALAPSFNRFQSVYVASPGPAGIETAVVRWLAGLVRFPLEGEGQNRPVGGPYHALAVLVHCCSLHI